MISAALASSTVVPAPLHGTNSAAFHRLATSTSASMYASPPPLGTSSKWCTLLEKRVAHSSLFFFVLVLCESEYGQQRQHVASCISLSPLASRLRLAWAQSRKRSAQQLTPIHALRRGRLDSLVDGAREPRTAPFASCHHSPTLHFPAQPPCSHPSCCDHRHRWTKRRCSASASASALSLTGSLAGRQWRIGAR